MHSPVTYFRWSLFSSFILYLCILPLSFVISFVFPGFWSKGIGIYSIPVVFLLNLILIIALNFYYRVSINSQGIKCSDFWGKLCFAEWSTITSARFYGGFWTLGLKFVLVSTTKLSKSLWLPLFLSNMPQFQHLASEYAGINNPLTIRLSELNTPAYLLKEAKAKIKLAWQAGMFSGVLTLILILLSLAGYRIGWIDMWSLIDACLIFGLSFGVYKKSRVAAVVMLIYFLFNQIYFVIEFKRAPGILSLLFLFIYAQGIQGTFSYRKLSRV